MEPHPPVPSIVSSAALVINLVSPESEQTEMGIRFLSTLLGQLELPATWVVDQPQQAKVIADQLLAVTNHELALTVEARSPQRLRSELANLQAAVKAASGQDVSVVMGDPQQLRSRTALLADLGIGAVVSRSQPSGPSKPPRLLPCGLWQFEPTVSIPQPRRRWSLLPTRRPSVKQLLNADSANHQQVVAIDLGQTNGRELQGCEQLLGEIAEAHLRKQLRVATISEFAVELASRHEVKPQRSILRRAA